MSDAHQPLHPIDLAYAFRVAAGDTPPTGDKPFSDHGQFGPGWIDKRCLLQTATWVDIHGTAHDLTAMTPQYRANLLAFLRHETPHWVHEAYATDITLVVSGVIAPEQASREIAALHTLPPGWADHTPLGLALHHLNHTTPDPLTPLPLPITADDSDTPVILRDHDTGSWTVTTHSHSRYSLDLDHRRVRRIPGQPTNGDRPASHLSGDGDWTHLTALVDCAVGRPLVILDQRVSGDSFRLSTAIIGIHRT